MAFSAHTELIFNDLNSGKALRLGVWRKLSSLDIIYDTLSELTK